MNKIINFISFYLFLTGSGVLVRCHPFLSPIFLLNDEKICEKKTSFDRSMIKLWGPVVRIIFYEKFFALNRYKTCAVSMSDTGKQQFTADQSIYQPSDRYHSVPDDIDL